MYHKYRIDIVHQLSSSGFTSGAGGHSVIVEEQNEEWAFKQFLSTSQSVYGFGSDVIEGLMFKNGDMQVFIPKDKITEITITKVDENV